MRDRIDHKILLNYSKGKYSYNDYLKVKNWFNRVEGNMEMKEQLFAQWEKLTEEDKSEDDSLQHIFEKIQYTILLEEKKRDKNNVIWNFYRKAAAILLIPVLAFSLWYYLSSKSPQFNTPVETIVQGWVEINAPDGARVEFFLPDSSSGWLNSGSKLKYPTVFNRQRKVKLTGEAYFEVKHLDQSDFIVSIADMDVKVLGTKFNVSAYSDEPCTYVVLNEGKVDINGKAGVFNYTLLPNEKITFNHKNKSLHLDKVNANRYSAWKEGYLIIENEPLGQIIARIERWYNVDIIIQDEELKNYRFKATFKDEPLEEVLRLMAKTTPMNYIIKKRTIDSEGILKRKEVTIKLK